MIKLGAPYPGQLLGKDPEALKAYFQAIEQLGYSYTACGDHVLGADRSVRPDWKPYFGKPPLFDYKDVFHEPFVLFGYLASLTKKLEFATTILILGQRQTALCAKQAAEVDFLSNGRLRIVAAVGWNDVEYEALGVDFHTRGARVEEQIKVMRMLWTQDLVTFRGKFHTITAAGITPMPVQRPIPVWIGGASEPVLKRAGRLGDGWYPSYPFFNEEQIRKDIALIHKTAKEHGRDPKQIGIQGMTFFHDVRFDQGPGDQLPPQDIEEGVAEAHAWKKLGATHYSVSALGRRPGSEVISRQEANARRALGDPKAQDATFGNEPAVSSKAVVDGMLEGLRRFKERLGKDF